MNAKLSERQTMRCKETRQYTSQIPCLELIRAPTKEQLAAYHAKVLNHSGARQAVYQAILNEIKTANHIENWNYRRNKNNPQPEALARLVVDEFINPAKYRKLNKLNRQANISSLALAMQCKSQTFKTTWFGKFVRFQVVLVDWYEFGIRHVDSV